MNCFLQLASSQLSSALHSRGRYGHSTNRSFKQFVIRRKVFNKKEQNINSERKVYNVIVRILEESIKSDS